MMSSVRVPRKRQCSRWPGSACSPWGKSRVWFDDLQDVGDRQNRTVRENRDSIGHDEAGKSRRGCRAEASAAVDAPWLRAGREESFPDALLRSLIANPGAVFHGKTLTGPPGERRNL